MSAKMLKSKNGAYFKSCIEFHPPGEIYLGRIYKGGGRRKAFGRLIHKFPINGAINEKV